ncbi:hypothetical protein BG006_007691 [Podila minutissima]|uniref:Uncharacterized protein n=1 Tax=Podila minutissima TaxID=64525 RepID=A0A9P5SHH1_9FUNG|nr:hypothetical protein BG006_007691 [Podila minutissima]
MFKLPIDQAFLASSLTKAIQPFSTTAPSEALFATASTTAKNLVACLPKSSHSKSSLSKYSLAKMLPPSALAPFAFWTISFLCASIMTTSVIVDAAPKKHTPAPNNLVSAMGFAVSPTSPLPLQLQLEARVAGTQKLAYLPTSGPAMDFYYLNYRPTYIAGESKLDFWMLTPQGSTPPKTASLELFDEYGKIRLATLVPAGTEVPAAAANKNEPFLWKSWTIPKTLKADFEFSEKFRVVLKTSSSSDNAKSVQVTAKKHGQKKNKREDEEEVPLVKNKNKHLNAANNAKTVESTKTAPTNNKVNPAAAREAVVVQDRQFRIKGLTATPGGQPNPAKQRVNSVAPEPAAPLTPSSSDKKVSPSPNTAPTSEGPHDQIVEEPTLGNASSAFKLHARVSSMATLAAISLAVVFIA